jgi:Ca-activated chloride channel homolog
MRVGSRTALLLLALAVSSVVSAQDTDDPIRVDSSIVVLNVSVADVSGKAVGGLPQKLFRIFEDGVEQEIRMFETGSAPFAAVILLDTSGSMEERIALARSAAIQFLSGLRPEDNVAIYNFHRKVDLVQEFSNSRDVNEQIFDLKAAGMTVLNDAVYMAASLLAKRPEKRRAIIVLSDGADTNSGRSADAALKAALAADATVYTVDMSATNGRPGAQNRGVLRNLAEKTGGRYIPTPGGAAMRDAFRQIVEELGGQYTLAYQPSNPKHDGKWRSIELRIARANLTIRTRKGYNAPVSK